MKMIALDDSFLAINSQSKTKRETSTRKTGSEPRI